MDATIDSHVHLDLIAQNHPWRIQWLRQNRCAVVSWAFGRKIRTIQALEQYLNAQRRIMKQMVHQGDVRAYYLCGIHPRNIPANMVPGDIADLLKPFLGVPGCLGIGEIGLETGTALEKEFFIAQLELARSLGDSELRIGVHTPRSNKEAVTRQILEVLNPFQDLKAAIVVDHCNARTIGTVLADGYMAGVTLSPPKTSFAELQLMLNEHHGRTHRIMCNTDSGLNFYEDLIRSAACPAIATDTKAAIFHDNAARFFSI